MKTNIENREYAGTQIPEEAKTAPSKIINKCINILDETYRIDAAPTKDFPNGEILVPKNCEYRLIAGDLELRDSDDGYDDESVFDRFFEKSFIECFYWSSFGAIDRDIIFLAPYSSANRQWMMNARFKDNIGITSIDGEFSIVGDISIRFCIVSGSNETMNNFDKAWGGVDKIKKDFIEYVKSMPNAEKREWALKYLIPLLEKYEPS